MAEKIKQPTLDEVIAKHFPAYKPSKPAKLTRREKDRIMADMGLTKCIGAVSGRVYYE